VCPTGNKDFKVMGIAIVRVEKITSSGSATGKTEHNYRLKEVPNADKSKEVFNHEYVNHDKDNIWKACNKRIEEVGVVRVRKDAVRGMEFILTASPETFERDAKGVVIHDYKNSEWVKENLKFMQDTYGANLVAFTLHQDEKTPHIHAVVVPITDKNRLSAKDMFNPKTLKALQTNYSEAMKPFGLERGLEGSKATHLTMQQLYSLHNTTEKSLKEDLKPIPTLDLKIDKPSGMDLLMLSSWADEQNRKIQQAVNLSLEERDKALKKANSIALENATAKRQVIDLKNGNNRLDGLNQKYRSMAQKSDSEKWALKKSINELKKDQENFILDIASGRFTPDEIFNMAVKIKANRIEHKNEVQNIKRKGGMSM
jgi:hypothetical protein